MSLIPEMTVAENVRMPLTYRGGISKEAQQQSVATAFERVNLDHRALHLPARLSLQRAA
jgi:putative ABC transport system ATP-binding protein